VIASFYRLVGFAVCHQLPERSLSVGGQQLPVCARDTGIYVGFIVAFVMIALMERHHPREMPPPRVLVTCLVFIALMGLDGVSSYAGWRTTTNDIRLITGLLAGFAIPPIVFGMLNYQLWRDSGEGRVLGSTLHQALLLVAIPLTFVILRFPIGALWWLYSTIVVAGVLTAFTSVNLVLVTLVPALERRATGILSMAPLVAAALLITVAELSAAGWMHSAATTLTR
jgi:uncharacterized membrane protein